MAPSEASPPTPPVGRAYEGFLYDTDAPHVVVTASSSSPPPSSSSAPIPPLRVVLPGTGNRPLDLSCLTRGVGSAAAEAGGDGGPTIALSYAFLPVSDATRNALCAERYGGGGGDGSDAVVARCVAASHQDVLWGGAREPALWNATAVADAVAGRLGLLLAHLASTRPRERWADYLRPADAAVLRAAASADGGGVGADDGEKFSLPEVAWERVVLGGHSQGAGHAGFLAATVRLAGAALLSGPQDECVGCAPRAPLWLDAPWMTAAAVRSARHANESAAAVIEANWQRMAAPDGGDVAWSRGGEDIGFANEASSGAASPPPPSP